MKEEYEYSFKVKDIDCFIKYCCDNNYILDTSYSQIRTLYKNNGKVMARITKNIYSDREEEILDFKEDNMSNNLLKVRRESSDLVIDDSNRLFVKSLIEILDLNKLVILKRKRYVYKRNNVTFEIDKYSEPLMNVVAIEGNKDEVDSVYDIIKTL